MKKILSLVLPLVWLAPLGRAQEPEAPPPLPPASTLTVVASEDYSFGEVFTPAKVGTDFSGVLPKIYVTLSTSAEALTFDFSARLVADDVKGLAHGTIIVPEGNTAVAEINPDKKQNYVEVTFPSTALLPGRYRLEIVENSPPSRVATSMAITAHLPALPAADALEVTLRKGDVARDFDDSLEPLTDFPSWPGKIFVTVKGPVDVA